MAATSKHYGDISLWVKKVIESSNANQYLATRNLIYLFDQYLQRNTDLSYDDRQQIIRKLYLELESVS